MPYSSTFAEEEQEVFTVHTGKDTSLLLATVELFHVTLSLLQPCNMQLLN